MTKSLLKNITNKFIVIEGNIGSGKTSLAKKISSQFGGKLILEKFSTNPFLPEFYKDPDSNALPLELFFLAERFHQLNDKQNLNDLLPVYVQLLSHHILCIFLPAYTLHQQ